MTKAVKFATLLVFAMFLSASYSFGQTATIDVAGGPIVLDDKAPLSSEYTLVNTGMEMLDAAVRQKMLDYYSSSYVNVKYLSKKKEVVVEIDLRDPKTKQWTVNQWNTHLSGAL